MSLFVLWTTILMTSVVVLGDATAPYPPPGIPAIPDNAPPAVPYVPHYSPPYREPPSYGLQTGYEGYLIPAPVADPDEEEEEEGGLLSLLSGLGEQLGGLGGQLGGAPHSALSGHSVFSPRPLLLLPLLGKFALPLKLLSKLLLWMLGPLSLVLLGGGLTVGVCVFTPICTLTFLGFGFSRDNVRNFINQDRLASITTFVTDAINKYQVMQKKDLKKEHRRFSSDTKTTPNSDERGESKSEPQATLKNRRK